MDITSVAAWEAGRYLPRNVRRRILAEILGCTVESLFSGESVESHHAAVAELTDTFAGLPPLLMKLAGQAERIRALRLAAPYATPAFVQKEFRDLVSRRILDGSLEVQRVEIVYALERLKEILSNVIRYSGKKYAVKVHCIGLTEVAPAMGGYFFDDSDFILGAYWANVPPLDWPGLHMKGEPFRTYYSSYWDEIWRRGVALNNRGEHDLSVVRDIAMRMGLPREDWTSFVDEARDFQVGDGAPPLI